MCRTCTEKLGITFDDWQDGAGRLILAKRADGTLAAMVDGVGLSLPRQVGKTYLIGALTFALCINTPGLLVIWSAHHARTHGETFLAMQGFAERGRVKPYVKQVFTGSGDEEIRFHNGSRILFGARERGFGRGIPGVDVLIFDEAQILSDRALSNMLATMNTSRFGLALYIGTPPKPDDMSESFQRMRREALAKTLIDGAWIEFGADKGANPDDRAQWGKANPSHPRRTPVQSILRLKRKLTLADFLREGLGIWDDDGSAGVIPSDAWTRCGNSESTILSAPQFALDIPPSRDSAAIAASGSNAAGQLHVELTSRGGVLDFRDRTEWVVPRLRELVAVFPSMRLKIAAGSGAETLRPEIEAAGIPVDVIPAREVAAACGLFFDLATRLPVPGLAHIGQDKLTDAVKAAKKRQENGESAWIWGRNRSSAPITGLYAATLALWAAYQTQTADYAIEDSIF